MLNPDYFPGRHNQRKIGLMDLNGSENQEKALKAIFKELNLPEDAKENDLRTALVDYLYKVYEGEDFCDIGEHAAEFGWIPWSVRTLGELIEEWLALRVSYLLDNDEPVDHLIQVIEIPDYGN